MTVSRHLQTCSLRRGTVSVVTVCAIVLSACGGGDDAGAPAPTGAPPTTTTTPTTTAAATTTPTAVATTTSIAAAPDTATTEAPATTTTEVAASELLTDQVLDVAGTSRSYHVFVPARAEGAPLVVLLHENGLDPDALLGLDGEAAPFGVWLELAEQERFVVAVPMGEGGGWNDCRSDAATNPTVDDVAFIGTMIDEIAAAHGIDASRVFATGLSNGGHMSIRLAEEAPDRIAGFAAVAAADSVASECTSSQVPVPALFMNGSGDGLMPFDGGAMANGAIVFSSAETVARWVERNGAAVEPTVETVEDLDPDDGSTVMISRYVAGPGGAPVVFYAVEGGGHNEPSLTHHLVDLRPRRAPQNRDIEMAEEVWRFFSEVVADTGGT